MSSSINKKNEEEEKIYVSKSEIYFGYYLELIAKKCVSS